MAMRWLGSFSSALPLQLGSTSTRSVSYSSLKYLCSIAAHRRVDTRLHHPSNLPKQGQRHFNSGGSPPSSPVELYYSDTANTSSGNEEPPTPMLAIHGLFGNSNNWKSILSRPAIVGENERRRIICVDARNHGRSPHDDVMTSSAMAGDIVALLDTLGIEKAIILGHSMGGKVAMTVASEAADRVSGLVVVDVAPIPYKHSEIGGFVAHMMAMNLSSITNRQQLEEEFNKFVPHPMIGAFLMTNAVMDSSLGHYRWRINLPALQQYISHDDQEKDLYYDGPTLFLAGSKSNYVQEKHHPLIHKMFPKADIEYLSTGHWVHSEDPAAFVTSLAQWLAKQS